MKHSKRLSTMILLRPFFNLAGNELLHSHLKGFRTLFIRMLLLFIWSILHLIPLFLTYLGAKKRLCSRQMQYLS